MTLDELIKSHDTDNMLGLLQGFAPSYAEAEKLAAAVALPKLGRLDAVVFAGMGGSALGAELALAATNHLTIPAIVSREYDVPPWTSEKTLVFAFSYSGSTEETLAAAEDARIKGATLFCASAGGRLEEFAAQHKLAHFKLPEGLPPRLSFHFFMLFVVRVLTELKLGKADMQHVSAALARSAEQFDPKKGGGDVYDLAQRLQGRTLLLYASSHLDAVARIWKAQFNENAKTFLHPAQLSELNHNEILTWKNLSAQTKEPSVMLLQSSRDTGQMAKRFDFTAKSLEEAGVSVIRLHSEGEDWAAELYSAALFGIWTSYYLALLNKENPTDIVSITTLKEYLA